MKVTRVGGGPVIDASSCDSIGVNIQGPSMVKVPDWVSNPLGRYYLYFADHHGEHIRLAWAADVTGPWTVHRPGTLDVSESRFLTEPLAVSDETLEPLLDRLRQTYGSDYSIEDLRSDATTPHVASPDVHVDHERERLIMYFHGLDELNVQLTRVALSVDGLNFDTEPDVLGDSYFRVFRFGGYTYALVMPGRMLRSADGLTNFEEGPLLFEPDMRHSAVLVRDGVLHVFWSRVGDAPESILHSTIDLSGDWMSWKASRASRVLLPELGWEGADEPVEPSRRGAAQTMVRQLRDPGVFADGDKTWLLYAAGGESGIGLASVTF